LLIIGSHLSLVFKFLPRTCHPITKTFKSLNNNQSKKQDRSSPSKTLWACVSNVRTQGNVVSPQNNNYNENTLGNMASPHTNIFE
jgi:hypothetical protein